MFLGKKELKQKPTVWYQQIRFDVRNAVYMKAMQGAEDDFRTPHNSLQN